MYYVAVTFPVVWPYLGLSKNTGCERVVLTERTCWQSLNRYSVDALYMLNTMKTMNNVPRIPDLRGCLVLLAEGVGTVARRMARAARLRCDGAGCYSLTFEHSLFMAAVGKRQAHLVPHGSTSRLFVRGVWTTCVCACVGVCVCGRTVGGRVGVGASRYATWHSRTDLFNAIPLSSGRWSLGLAALQSNFKGEAWLQGAPPILSLLRPKCDPHAVTKCCHNVLDGGHIAQSLALFWP
jgi:hypothetical protein